MRQAPYTQYFYSMEMTIHFMFTVYFTVLYVCYVLHYTHLTSSYLLFLYYFLPCLLLISVVFSHFLSRLSGGELFDRLVEKEYTLTEEDCITYMRQICQGVQHMHHNNILHLDLKVTSCDQLQFTPLVGHFITHGY